MNNSHEVVSAFLDDRPFVLQDLASALEQPDGRELLIDLLALRQIVQPTDPIRLALPATVPARNWLRPAVAAAAVVAALAGGYVVGTKHAPTLSSEAPAATRVVEVPATWQDMPIGGQR